MAFIEGDTNEDRAAMIGLIHSYLAGETAGSKWAPYVIAELIDADLWFPWLVLWVCQPGAEMLSGAWGFVDRPSPQGVENRKRKLAGELGVNKAKIKVAWIDVASKVSDYAAMIAGCEADNFDPDEHCWG